MTEQNRFAPGWYKDPAGAPLERWYNGAMWTEDTRPLPAAPQYGQFQAPGQAPQQYAQPGQPQFYAGQQQYPVQYGRPFQPQLPPTVEVNSVWIWAVGLLPLLSLLSLFIFDFQGYLVRAMDTSTVYSSLSIYTDPSYLLIVGLGWVVYAALIVSAFRDYRHLQSVGLQRPFHWAWTFLSSLVYVIGRAVVVNRSAPGRGTGQMWIAITVQVASFVIVMVWTISAINTGLQYVFDNYSTYGVTAFG